MIFLKQNHLTDTSLINVFAKYIYIKMFLLGTEQFDVLHVNFEPNSIRIIYYDECFSFQRPKLRSTDNVTLSYTVSTLHKGRKMIDSGGCSFRKREAAAG